MTLKFLMCAALLLSNDFLTVICAAKITLPKSAHIITQAQHKQAASGHSTPTPAHKELKEEGLLKQQKQYNFETTELDTEPLFNGYKKDLPWNPYISGAPTPAQFPYALPMPALPSMFDGYSPFMSKLFPFFGYPQPLIIPYPVMMTPDMLYNSFEGSQPLTEDSMSRTSTNGRRPPPSAARNSPIYYFRLPPTSYMFLPSFNYPSTPSYPQMLPFPQISAYHALPMSSILNLPLNYLANGKPSGIYRIDGPPNDLSSTNFQFAGTRPSPYRPQAPPEPSPSSFPVQRPAVQFNFPSPSPPSVSNAQDSKLTLLKRPYVFNGRPEDIYILPNNFNPTIFSEGSFY